jgi:hypothetical protein
MHNISAARRYPIMIAASALQAPDGKGSCRNPVVCAARGIGAIMGIALISGI